MSDDLDFLDMIAGARRRDQMAATTLVRTTKPALLRLVRRQLGGLGLGHLLDAEDVCQVAFATFFARLGAGNFEIDTFAQLDTLLAHIARNQVLDEARRLWAQRRAALRRVAAQDEEDCLHRAASSDPTPSADAAGSELVEEIHRRMSAEERRLAVLRADGHDWPGIAETIGGSPDALRKKLARAYERVLRELGLEELLLG